jgi:hypothetical protein
MTTTMTTTKTTTTTRALSFSFLLFFFLQFGVRFEEANAYSHSTTSTGDSSTEPEYYCVGVCEISVADAACGGDAANQRTTECNAYDSTSADAITLSQVDGSTLTGVKGFVGCKETSCASYCASSGVTSEDPFKLMNVAGRNVICVVSGKTKFMTESQAVMHAYSKGCTGAHAMGDPAMYMAGATHTACDHIDATTTTSGAAYSSTMMSQNALAVSSACVASLLALLLLAR